VPGESGVPWEYAGVKVFFVLIFFFFSSKHPAQECGGYLGVLGDGGTQDVFIRSTLCRDTGGL